MLGKFTFQGKEFPILEYINQKLEPRYKYIAIDTETHLVDDWTQTPDMVTFQAFDGNNAYYVYPNQVAEFLKTHKDIELVFHNFPFDHDVLKKLLKDEFFFFDYLEKNLIADTSILYRLIKLKEIGFIPFKYNLALCTKEYLHEELPKDEHLRMNWGNYVDTPFKDIPKDVLEYGAKDVAATYFLYNSLRSRLPDDCKNELTHRLQIKADVALNNIYKRGISVKPALVSNKLDHLMEKLKKLQVKLSHWGWVRGMKGNQEAFEAACKVMEIYDKIPKTRELTKEETATLPQLKVSINPGEDYNDYVKRRNVPITPEILANLELERKAMIDKMLPLSTKEYDLRDFMHIEFISNYVEFHKLEKLTSFLKPLVGRSRVHPRYQTIKNTGRTSCSSPNIQQLPRGEFIREVFQAPQGKSFVIADYSSLELATLAQICYTKFGHSKIGDLINENADLHIYTATQIYNKPADKVLKKERQFAKIPNYGFGANMGYKTFVEYCIPFGINIDEKFAKQVKETWVNTYPEMKEFFGEAEKGATVETLTGRQRGNCTYTGFLNTQFQGLAADGAKLALFECEKAGLSVVAFVHDEIIIESDDDKVEEEALLLEKIMVESMQVFTPDVKIEAKPQISKVYDK